MRLPTGQSLQHARWSDDANTVHGPPLQARVVAADRAVLANHATILAHMAMNKGRGNAEQNGGKKWMRAAGMAWQNKAVAGKHSRQMKWPAQALQ